MPPKHLLRASQWLGFVAALLLLLAAPAAAQGNSHVVQAGENLFRIALRYGVTVDAMARANNIANPAHIYAGQVLVIPGNEQPSADTEVPSAPAPASQPAATQVYHTVQRGETLRVIGERYGIGWQQIAERNNIPNPNRILVGQQLVIPTAGPAPAGDAAAPPVETVSAVPPAPAPAPAVTTAPATTAPRTHVVQPGEYLSSIARRYGVSWTEIARANNIVDPNRVLVGQSLVIPGSSGANPTYMEPSTGQPSGPAPTVTNGKQIIVDLSDQRIYAYQDGAMMRAVTVSTGLPATPTVTGDFNIYWKLNSQTMSGPGYYLPGVPWVMYFYAGYAIHGTYWHNNFGQPMSHGCVNLPSDEALWFFNFAEVGTPVRVIY
ncbi:MAG: LysM peptidoglycan-binding domain-containing protein [Anaerolineae bacterium]|nr:LysM peptidoglycan-binding domain-containing protein [Anaerolineae bacterium]